METSPRDVLISYNSRDFELAQEVYDRLRPHFSVWFDKDRIRPGDHWFENIEEACDICNVVVPVMTRQWQESEWTKYETYPMPFKVAVLLEGEWLDVAPTPLRGHQYLDLREPTESKWTLLIDSVRHQLTESQRITAKRGKTGRYGSHMLRYPVTKPFVGREKLLNDICESLYRSPTPGASAGTVIAVSGLAGIGKTTLARQYAERFWRLYSKRLWVTATPGYDSHGLSYPGRIDTWLQDQFASLSTVLGHRPREGEKPAEAARWVLNRLSNQSHGRSWDKRRCLLIFDNVEDHASIREWIPKTGNCHVIMTSRFAEWSEDVERLHVQVLEVEPSCDLLIKLTHAPDNPANREAASGLAKKLGYLPLALTLVGTLIHESYDTIDGFSERFDQSEERAEVLKEERTIGSDCPRSIVMVFSQTLLRLTEQSLQILHLLAFLAPDCIPRKAIYQGLLQLHKDRELNAEDQSRIPVRWTVTAFNRLLHELVKYSVIELGKETVTIHRLLQTVVRDLLNDSQRRNWAIQAIRALDASCPQFDYDSWPEWQRLMPSVWVCIDHINHQNIRTVEAGRLLNNAGGYLWERGNYDEAEKLSLHGLRILEEVAPQSLDYVKCLQYLGDIFEFQSRYREAEQNYVKADSIICGLFPPTNREVLQSKNYLACLYTDTGRYLEAKPLYEHVLRVRLDLENDSLEDDSEEALAKRDEDIRTSLGNLAELYIKTGEYREAEQLLLECRRRENLYLSPQDLDIAWSLNWLGEVYIGLGRLDEAEPYLLTALAMREGSGITESASNSTDNATSHEFLGPHHPYSAWVKHNLGDLYRLQGRYEESEAMYNKALEVRIAVEGDTHPDISASYCGLAELWAAKGNMEEAMEFFLKALTLEERADPPRDNLPDSATILIGLARVYFQVGRISDAKQCCERSLQILQHGLGADNIRVAQTIEILSEIGELPQSE